METEGRARCESGWGVRKVGGGRENEGRVAEFSSHKMEELRVHTVGILYIYIVCLFMH